MVLGTESVAVASTDFPDTVLAGTSEALGHRLAARIAVRTAAFRKTFRGVQVLLGGDGWS